MNNLLRLLKITFINNLGLNAVINKNMSKEDKKKSLRTFGMLLLIAVVVLFVVCVYTNAIAMGLIMINSLNLLPMIAGLVVSIVVLFTSMFKASGTLFSSKDYDFLMSLPLSSKTILTNKMIELLSLNFVISALVLIPSTIIYFIRANGSPLSFLVMIIGVFILPLIPIVIASIFAFIISFISSKVRFTKIFSLVGGSLLILGIMLASAKANVLIEYLSKKTDTIINTLSKIYPPSAWFANGIVNNDIISLIKFILVSIIPFIIFIIIFAKQFKKINSKLGESYKKSDYKMTTLKTKNALAALISKEFRRLFSSVPYVMNTILLPVILTVMCGISSFTAGDQINSLPESITSRLILLLIAGLSIMMSMGSTTPSSISIEGNNLWILKSLPVKIIDIFKAKIAVYVILAFPCIVITSILVKIGLGITLIEMLWAIIIVTMYTLLTSIIGLFINLNFPKFNWQQEIQAVKNTISVTIALFASLVPAVVLGAIYFIFININMNIFLVISTIILLVFIMLAWKVLKTKGTELFRGL
ncbi:putative ABC transporter permease subunit [Clostridium paraputrificum]|uniref:putative ABC transporter permease subunit n=1 Tax=Clostridium TaxID=1485 RepID=UPI003D330322